MEGVKRIKTVGDSLMEDRISNLPCNLKECILELMPIPDAVRAGILSTKWKYIWTCRSKFEFNLSFYNNLKPKPVALDIWLRIIFKILLLHEGPIHSFLLHIPFQSLVKDYIQNSPTGDINELILFLSRRGVKEFTLENLKSFQYRLPSHLFSCTELTNLRVYWCSLDVCAANFQGLPNLTTLEFISVKFIPKAHQHCAFILKQLQRLTLLNCSGVAKVHICSSEPPCRCENHGRLADLTIFVAQSLQELYLSHVSTSSPVDISGCSAKLEKLHLNNLFHETSPAGISAKMIHLSAFKCLKKLKITLGVNHRKSSYEFYCPLCLIQHSSMLVELDITTLHGNIVSKVHWPPNCLEKDCKMSHLKYVKFRDMQCSTFELKLIEFLLLRSPVLERMLIEQERIKNLGNNVREKTLIELLSFSRASTKSQIIYSVCKDSYRIP